MQVTKPVSFVALGCASLFSVLLFAQQVFAQHGDHAVTDKAAAEKIMQERQDNFEQIGESFKVIRDQLRERNTDVAAIQDAAQTINALAKDLPTWFPAGTGPETAIETEAKAEIWQDRNGFNAAAQRFIEESDKFLALTASGDKSKIGGGVRGLGGACKNCHDNYRVDKD